MFSDPQSITVSAVAQSMARTTAGTNLGVFTQDDGTNSLKIEHTYGKRTRRTARFIDSKIAANPYDTTQNQDVSCSVYIVFDHPKQGYTNAELKALADGFMTWLTASSGANITKLLAGEM